MVLLQMRPEELAEPARPGEAQIHLDATETVLALAAVAVATIGYALIISWVISRRAVRPLAHALQVQRAFVADASHELRTPLAVLDARVQLLGHQLERGDAADSTRATAPDPGHDPGDSGGAGVRETARELRDDTRQLIAIVNDLLAAASVEDADAEAVITDAGRVVGETVESLRVLAGSRGIELGCAVPEEPVPVTMPTSGLRRCVTSLIDNAMAHSAGSACRPERPGRDATRRLRWEGRADGHRSRTGGAGDRSGTDLRPVRARRSAACDSVARFGFATA
ncbi:MAG: HAMP domain-containing histidine kinase [Acidipropionibacterium sp.]|nr:HAMP domain-containing histidine kinase [Acidipropionibacterium sp.]